MLAGVLGSLAGCGIGGNFEPGTESVFQIFEPPSPEEAVAWSLDEYNADNRYRGITLLTEASFGGEPLYLRLYRERLDDPDPGVRQAAARALGVHGEPEDAVRVSELLEDDNRLTRAEAARALQKLHNPAVIDDLIDRTVPENEPFPEARAAAARALGQYESPRVIQALISALQDRRLSVNRSAVISLETLTGQNFSLDGAAWLAWLDQTDDPFKAGRMYTYPGFQRPRHPVEWIPFVPQPPNVPAAAPVGLRSASADG